MDLDGRAKTALFERIVTPHVPAAWNLARWLLRDQNDAEDVLQEAYLRAFRFLDSFRGGDARGWFLTIVRNVCHDTIRQRKSARMKLVQEETFDQIESDVVAPLDQLEKTSDAQQVRRAVDSLPIEYREILILREFEGLSYKEIAEVADVPLGTVMSRLARARERLVTILAPAGAEQEGGR